MDDYRREHSDYEPNFVMQDGQPQDAAEQQKLRQAQKQAWQESRQRQSDQTRQQTTSNISDASTTASGMSDAGEARAFRDPRENFRKASAQASYSYNNQDASGNAYGTYSTREAGYAGNTGYGRNTQQNAASGDTGGFSDSSYDNTASSYNSSYNNTGSDYSGTEGYGSSYDSTNHTAHTGASAAWSGSQSLGKTKKSRTPKKPAKPITFTRRSLALLMALCVVVSGVFGFGGAAVGNLLFDGSSGPVKMGSATAAGYKLEDATDSNLTVQEITEMAKSSVVEIKTESVTSDVWMQQYVTQGAGSGVIITNDGYIVTNNHVIEGASKIMVATADGKEYEAELIGADSNTDVAVLKINAKNLTPATYGNSDQLAVGDLAVAIGNPLGELGGTVTAGIISALDRQLSLDGKTMTLLQTDSSINPGNSGGGLFNDDGQLIGIVIAKSSGSDIEGLGFAIPINTAADVAQQLMDKGYVSGQPSTGMTYTEAGGQQSGGIDQFFGGGQSSTGVYIYSIEGENAKRAGFQPGDMVYAVDGVEITSFNELSSIITSHQVGDKITYTILRNGQAMEITFELEEKQAES